MTPALLILASTAFAVPGEQTVIEFKVPETTIRTSTVPSFPKAGSVLRKLEVIFPKGFGKKRIYIDPGHGLRGNEGTGTLMCEQEQAVNLRIASELARQLKNSRHFRARLARKDHNGPSYKKRVRQAEAWSADVIVSIHADARGSAHYWEPEPGLSCLRNDNAAGFSILWSDKGPMHLVKRRRTLGRAVALRMSESGFLPYNGWDYEGLFDTDSVAGSFVDRRRLYMLRKPSIPSVIIETHHALHFDEWSRWREPATIRAFAQSVMKALVETLTRK